MDGAGRQINQDERILQIFPVMRVNEAHSMCLWRWLKPVMVLLDLGRNMGFFCIDKARTGSLFVAL
jgi:hypothetical protein